MPRTPRRVSKVIVPAGGAVLAVSLLGMGSASAEHARPPDDALPTAAELDYTGSVDVVPAGEGEAEDADTVTGVVFHDVNMDGTHQPETEPGVANVVVANGRDVTRTDAEGRYALPAEDDMTVFVTKPNDWAVPLDEDNIPQMSYHHKPEGSPPLRFGGLEPTGPLPDAVNFPMVPTRPTNDFRCVVMGDTQPYSNTEVGYVRDSIVTDLLERDLDGAECMLLLGDVVGDDLGLLPRFKRMMSAVGLPQYYVPGNHDYDHDATDDADSTDTWRREYGPPYFSFDIGQVHFVVLDNAVYPCTEEDLPDACGDPDAPTYNGRVTDRQLEWLANDLEQVPEHTLVVLSHHIPLLSFIDNDHETHQTDNAQDLYDLLAGREAVSLSGHTHTLDQILPGESYAGWSDVVGVDEAPFHHVIAGAPSGAWYSGDLDWDGVPMSLGSLGEPRGYMVFDFSGPRYTDSFHASGHDPDRQMWTSFNTPQYRAWFEELREWTARNPNSADGVPPVNVNDLADTKLFTPEDLAEGVFLTANVWNGSRDSDVSVRIDDGEPLPLSRTQDGEGEEVRYGVDHSDPYAVVRQMQTARYALVSESGEERAQGWQQTRGNQRGPGAPQSVAESYIAEKSSHLWRVAMPEDLPIGSHVAEVSSVDRYGRTSTDSIAFEVAEERPTPFWRTEPWED
ncbi:calcineurin-like phosphoesterase C-terminal domain-containing protein [Spiractinospora alimapuensis]|uniref:calcineurin-like phosphoesterase C-terminal domain-containing protein n=1 Tax=Spiractinospora alimapuensis TaxID=2820884 RepID=UPI001F15B3E9|nr:calcineurin-like phosphoesterase family protein [Spiractinospora alimapuensis]QVQ52334.1 calcineurin-like phosphoesterase C-terminal domain-containing protein [Spiractinospora alimapuensis]